MTGEGYIGMRLGELMEKYRQKTYRGDVCVRCGKLVNDPLDTKRQITIDRA